VRQELDKIGHVRLIKIEQFRVFSGSIDLDVHVEPFLWKGHETKLVPHSLA